MPQPSESPVILGFVSDLLFGVKIESTAARLGFEVRWIEHADIVAPQDPLIPPRQPAEHLVGRGAALLDLLTRILPALIIFDLNNNDIPWREWLPLVKSAPATRRMPVLCFASHVDVESINYARSCGADEVLARSRFVEYLPQLIRKHARIIDIEAMLSACREPLSGLALKGLEAFNRGDYFLSHEELELAWNQDSGPGRELYRAILQVAVAYLQIVRGNYRGAMKMFLRVRQWIDPLPDECRGVDVARLRSDAVQVHRALESLGPERIDQFDRILLRPVHYTA